jgi:hypothetical protein
VEQAHLGTTRYTTLSLSVIQVPGKPIYARLLGERNHFVRRFTKTSRKKQTNSVFSMTDKGI